ncbi:MAG: putative polymerase, sigma-24 subunit, subfamily [Actinomycetia bacterium]|nr:putative polymerase, sigma-24 subunit, subfamily [Actinomycetes bacterium]
MWAIESRRRRRSRSRRVSHHLMAPSACRDETEDSPNGCDDGQGSTSDAPLTVEWYEELVRLTDSPVARLNRAVALGEAEGPHAGLAALAELDPALPRYTAAAAYLHERAGDPATAARLYAEAARSAPNLPERDHLTRQAARLNARLSPTRVRLPSLAEWGARRRTVAARRVPGPRRLGQGRDRYGQHLHRPPAVLVSVTWFLLRTSLERRLRQALAPVAHAPGVRLPSLPFRPSSADRCPTGSVHGSSSRVRRRSGPGAGHDAADRRAIRSR